MVAKYAPKLRQLALIGKCPFRKDEKHGVRYVQKQEAVVLFPLTDIGPLGLVGAPLILGEDFVFGPRKAIWQMQRCLLPKDSFVLPRGVEVANKKTSD
jgi:hypothetical protein